MLDLGERANPASCRLHHRTLVAGSELKKSARKAIGPPGPLVRLHCTISFDEVQHKQRRP